MTPLSARTYLEAYDDFNPHNKIPLLRKFNGRDLVTVGALKETWPHGEWRDNGFNIGDKKHNPTESSEHAESGPAAAAIARLSAGKQLVGRSQHTPQGRTKSLRNLSMDNLLDMLLHSAHDDSDLIAEAEIFPDFVGKLRRRLYDHAETLQPTTSVINLVYKALKEDVEVDLSVFKNFAVGDLALLVAKLRRGKMKVLNLSNMLELTDSGLQQILNIHQASSKVTKPKSATSVVATGPATDLSAIVLLETPKISVNFLSEHMGHYDIYHSALFRRPMHNDGVLAYFDRKEPLQALQFGGTNTVSQLIWVGTTSRQSCDSKLRLENGQFDWSSLKYSADAYCAYHYLYLYTRDTDLKYKNFLLDVPLPAAKTVHSLQRLTQYLYKLSWQENWPKAAARCFATTSNLDDGAYSVGPLSTTLYQDDTNNRHQDFVESGKGRPLMPGQWAIILVQEAFDARDQKSLDDRDFGGIVGTEESETYPAHDNEFNFKPLKRLRYAFVKALSESDPSKQHLLVTGVSGYVEDVLGGKAGDTEEAERVMKWWRKQKHYADYYKDADMDEILHKIYSDRQLVVHQRFERGQWKRLKRSQADQAPPPAQPPVNTPARVIVAVPPPQPARREGLRPRR